MNFASDFCAVDECCSFGFVIHQMKLLGDHLCIMFHLRMQRKYGDRTICRFFIRVTGANLPVYMAVFSHWKTLISDALSMPCSVTTAPISLKACTKGHRWSKNGDAALSSSLFICIQKQSSLTGAKNGRFSVTGKMSVRGAIAGRAHVKVLQRDEFFDSVTAAWNEGGS